MEKNYTGFPDSPVYASAPAPLGEVSHAPVSKTYKTIENEKVYDGNRNSDIGYTIPSHASRDYKGNHNNEADRSLNAIGDYQSNSQGEATQALQRMRRRKSRSSGVAGSDGVVDVDHVEKDSLVADVERSLKGLIVNSS